MNANHYLSTLIILFVLIYPSFSFAQMQDSISVSDKIDSIYTLQMKIYNEQKNTPLYGKKFGVELNLFRLLLYDENRTLSGGFSLFDINRGAEIAFPVYFLGPRKKSGFAEFTLDCHYRYFVGNTQNGLYLSAFTRYAHLRGRLKRDYMLDNNLLRETGTENKLGIGFGMGYRMFSYKGLYWGCSFSFGRYIIGENYKFSKSIFSIDNDMKFIFDVEFLKFGWAF